MQPIEKGVLAPSQIYLPTPSAMAKRTFFYMEAAGDFICDNEYCVSRDEFLGFLLLYVVSGQMVAEAAGNEYVLGSGELLLIDTTRPHIYAARGRIHIIWMHFCGATSRAWYELISQNGHVHTPADPIGFEKQFLACIALPAQDLARNEALVSCQIQSLLCSVYLTERELEQKKPMQEVVRYIETHYQQPLCLQTLCAQAHLSVYHFCRLFKKQTGYSPHSYLVATRMKVAKHMLLRTDHSIKRIAFDCGFSGESHFVSAFKKHCGSSPGAFRKSD